MLRTLSQISATCVAVAVVAASVLILETQHASANKICKPAISAQSGILPNDNLAKTEARTKWGVAAVVANGPGYNNWANAENKVENCRTVTNAYGMNGRRCAIRARPCVHT